MSTRTAWTETVTRIAVARVRGEEFEGAVLQFRHRELTLSRPQPF
jgi:hypothetical protein